MAVSVDVLCNAHRGLTRPAPCAVTGLRVVEGFRPRQGALTTETCDAVLAYINGESERAKAAVEAGQAEFSTMFGGVNCRGMNGQFGYRQDMFLPMTHATVGAAKSSLGDAETSLGDAESSLGGAKSSLGDAETSLGDAESSLGAD